MATKAKTAKLSRQKDQRNALMRSLAESLILQESIVTTEAKARALRPYVEKLVTKAGQDTEARRRLIRSRLDTAEAAEKLYTDIAPRFRDRPGGYTRLSREGIRRGDNAPLMRISFVEQAPAQTSEPPAQKRSDRPESGKEEQ